MFQLTFGFVPQKFAETHIPDAFDVIFLFDCGHRHSLCAKSLLLAIILKMNSPQHQLVEPQSICAILDFHAFY